MSDLSEAELTRLLHAVHSGDKLAETRLFELVYDTLKRIASRIFDRERSDHTLQPTAVVNELYLRLFAPGLPRIISREHFYSLAALSMRRLLIDHARRNQPTLPLPEDFDQAAPGPNGVHAQRLIDLSEACDELSRRAPRLARVVELRFYLGMTIREIADLLEVSTTTIDNRWNIASRWLSRRLRDYDGE